MVSRLLDSHGHLLAGVMTRPRRRRRKRRKPRPRCYLPFVTGLGLLCLVGGLHQSGYLGGNLFRPGTYVLLGGRLKASEVDWIRFKDKITAQATAQAIADGDLQPGHTIGEAFDFFDIDIGKALASEFGIQSTYANGNVSFAILASERIDGTMEVRADSYDYYLNFHTTDQAQPRTRTVSGTGWYKRVGPNIYEGDSGFNPGTGRFRAIARDKGIALVGGAEGIELEMWLRRK